VGSIGIVFATIFVPVLVIIFGPVLLPTILAAESSNTANGALMQTVALTNELMHSPDATVGSAVTQYAPFLMAALAVAAVIFEKLSQVYSAYQLARDAKKHLSPRSS
jgi:hypothetical protein